MMFGFDVNDVPTYTLEVYIGNALVNKQKIKPIAFPMMVMQFAQLCEQISNENQPMKCICRGVKEIQLPNGDYVEKPARVEFYNNKWDDDIV